MGMRFEFFTPQRFAPQRYATLHSAPRRDATSAYSEFSSDNLGSAPQRITALLVTTPYNATAN